VPEGWATLLRGPAFGLGLTLLVYVVATRVQRRAGGHPLVNPVALSIAMIITLLTFTGISYRTYFESAQPIHLLLGPATVALAVPLHAQLHRVRRLRLVLAGALVIACVVAMATALGLAHLLQVSPLTQLALGAKSVTAPIAMGIAQALGADPTLTAGLVILTGILGAMLGPVALDLAGVRDETARGFAIGLASHGIGTARAMQMSEAAGAFARLAMGLNGIATALLLPLVVRLLGLP
jgi:predicted murein hydrolase (TIGR00659 family)